MSRLNIYSSFSFFFFFFNAFSFGDVGAGCVVGDVGLGVKVESVQSLFRFSAPYTHVLASSLFRTLHVGAATPR